jgi:hypothetical protein
MKKQRPVWFVMVICSAALGLASCQNPSDNPFANLFGSAPTPSPSCSATADTSVATKLQAENAKLKKQLADAMHDNAMLRDLAAKTW